MDERDEDPRPERAGEARRFVFRPARKHRLTAAEHGAIADRLVERTLMPVIVPQDGRAPVVAWRYRRIGGGESDDGRG